MPRVLSIPHRVKIRRLGLGDGLESDLHSALLPAPIQDAIPDALQLASTTSHFGLIELQYGLDSLGKRWGRRCSCLPWLGIDSCQMRQYLVPT